MRERTKGYVGTVLDGKKLATIANQVYAVQYPDFSKCKVDDLLLIELEEKNSYGDPRYAVICSEGVGWEQDTYGCIEIPTNIGQGGYYNGRVFISVEKVKACQTIFKKDISDYIRVFGDRLDNNRYLWQSKMSDPSVMVEA